MFKVNDRVKVVKENNLMVGLELNEIYTILQISSDFCGRSGCRPNNHNVVYINTDFVGYCPHRFVLVKDSIKSHLPEFL